jgi:Icc protein
LLLVTGDLSQDGSVDSYRYLSRVLKETSAPVRCIPGNHDDRDHMSSVLPADMAGMGEPLRFDQWSIVLLDSVVPGAVHGALGEDALENLEQRLQRSDSRYAMIAVHHPPIALGSRWMDEIRLRDGDRLLALLEQFAAVKLLVWGHAHQEFAGRHGSISTYGTPSTCFQFRPGSDDFALDEAAPGYRVFDLAADGRFATEVVRVAGSKAISARSAALQ